MAGPVTATGGLHAPISEGAVMETPMVEIEQLNLWYGLKQALNDITMSMPKHRITAFIGPSGCGKSTLLRCLNRMNDLVDGVRITGSIRIGGTDIYDTGQDVTELRKRVGMVFQKSNPFPKSVFENGAYGPRILGVTNRSDLEGIVERSLRAAALWDEVMDRLDDPAISLSGGQQQRLCLARVLALEPEVILLDEPTSGLDPLSTGKVEASLHELKSRYTIVLVPHSIQQAARMADYAAFVLDGQLIEVAPGKEIFTRPRDRRTQEYVEGRFG